MNSNILIIDDDMELTFLLKECLLLEGIKTDIAHDGQVGLQMVLHGDYHLVVLDIILPILNGFEVLAALRKQKEVPVLMLTAKNDEKDKVSGLRLGADDYLTKPFSVNEFIARVQSQIRRYTTFNAEKTETDHILAYKDLKIDSASRTTSLCNEKIQLTGKEFDVLYLLASNPCKVFTKKQIYRHVWGDEYAFDDNNIMSYMSKLRKKLGGSQLNWEYIQTVWGVGYRFNAGEEPQ